MRIKENQASQASERKLSTGGRQNCQWCGKQSETNQTLFKIKEQKQAFQAPKRSQNVRFLLGAAKTAKR